MDLRFVIIVLLACDIYADGGKNNKAVATGADCSEVGLLTVMFRHLEQRTKKLEQASESKEGKIVCSYYNKKVFTRRN